LTGETREHALFFLYGTGAHGKSTFLNALTGCLGSIIARPPLKPLQPQKSTVIRPNLLRCKERGWLQVSKQKRAAAGPKQRLSP
jgi:hypothetical protein